MGGCAAVHHLDLAGPGGHGATRPRQEECAIAKHGSNGPPDDAPGAKPPEPGDALPEAPSLPRNVLQHEAFARGYPERSWLTNGVMLPIDREMPVEHGPLLVAPGVITHSAQQVIEWARSRSLWMLMFGLACCAIEMMATNAALFDLDRFGVMPRGSPRQSDLLVVSGTVTYKVAPMVERVYRQMAEPRWVIAMGNCATAGSLYYHDGYSVVKGADQIVPVDVYISGCPPRPEALIDGILELERIIRGDAPSERPDIRRGEERA